MQSVKAPSQAKKAEALGAGEEEVAPLTPEQKELAAQEAALKPIYDLPKATDPSYGMTPQKPIRCGGYEQVGLVRQFEIISRLKNSEGKPLFAQRIGSFQESPRTPESLIQVWQIRAPEAEQDTFLYLDSQNWASPQVPQGFTYDNEENPTERTMLYPSQSDYSLESIHNVVIDDGVDYEESINIAQCYLIQNHLEVDFDLSSAQYEEGSSEDTHIISFERRTPNISGTQVVATNLNERIYKLLFEAPKLTVFVHSRKDASVWSLLDVYRYNNFTQTNTD